jgi:hypothetical protein
MTAFEVLYGAVIEKLSVIDDDDMFAKPFHIGHIEVRP